MCTMVQEGSPTPLRGRVIVWPADKAAVSERSVTDINSKVTFAHEEHPSPLG